MGHDAPAQKDQLPSSLSSIATPRATSTMLLATTLLLGCVGSLASARAADVISGTLSVPTSVEVGSLRRWSGSSRQEDGDEKQRLLTGVYSPRGGRTGSHSTPWVVARTTRGGGFRRRSSSASASEPPVIRIPAEEKRAGDGGGIEGTAAAAAAGAGAGGHIMETKATVDEEDREARSEGDSDDGDGSVNDEQASDDEAERANRPSDHGSGDSGDDDDGRDEEEEGGGEMEGADEESRQGKGGDEGEESNSVDGDGGRSEATPEKRKQPVAPLFSFPPGPRVDRTQAEESLQEILPMQQRLVKYLTEDRVFGAQILCSVYFLMSAMAYSVDSTKFRGCYQTALMSLTIKQWGTVLGRVRRVLVPHLIYEPQSRYVKYRARVSALALDPAVQGILYCGIFMFMPLGLALLPLLLKEAVYLLWVVKEVLQIAAPGLVGALTSLFEAPMSVLMTAGDAGKWRDTPEADKRLLLGRRLAQVCFKLEMAMPFSIALKILPGAIQATLGGVQAVGDGEGDEMAALGGVFDQTVRAFPLIKIGLMMLAYVKLLTVRNTQLEDDVRVLRGLKIRGYNLEWTEQVVDSVVFGRMVGCPWWAGLLASLFALLPNHEATKTVMASDDKLKTLGMALLNLAIGRTPGAEDDDDEEAEEKVGGGDGDDESPTTRISRIAKVAAVATGISDF